VNLTLKPAAGLSGVVIPAADKSITHRAIMISALSEGVSVIDNYLAAGDCVSTLKAFEQMGVRHEIKGGSVAVHGRGLGGLSKPSGIIDAGNSGTTVRLLSGILAAQNFSATITGDASLSKRPMKRIIEPLSLMGASLKAREGTYLPLEIAGNPELKPITYKSPVPSAQVKSCVLLAGLFAKGVTRVIEPVKSRDHSELMLLDAGADIRVNGLEVSVTGPARLKAFNKTVPADISSAAFFMVAGLICGKSSLEIKGVGVNPTRDGILEVLMKMGAKIKLTPVSGALREPVSDLRVESSALEAVNISGGIIPRLVDEIPVLVLAATQARGTTVISGAGELRVKESDRLKTVSSQLNLMGADITEKADGLEIKGPTKLKGAAVESFGDHRVAMTLAIASLIAEGETVISDVDCVNTSFPEFFGILKNISGAA